MISDPCASPAPTSRWKREQKWAGNNDDTDDSNDSADLPKWQQDKKWESNV